MGFEYAVVATGTTELMYGVGYAGVPKLDIGILY